MGPLGEMLAIPVELAADHAITTTMCGLAPSTIRFCPLQPCGVAASPPIENQRVPDAEPDGPAGPKTQGPVASRWLVIAAVTSGMSG